MLSIVFSVTPPHGSDSGTQQANSYTSVPTTSGEYPQPKRSPAVSRFTLRAKFSNTRASTQHRCMSRCSTATYIRSYRSYLDRRRALRPIDEYREPTTEEWAEFEQHFAARKLELGTCGRPYGTPCNHEHACIRCPMRRMDPAARPRLVTIVANLNERI